MRNHASKKNDSGNRRQGGGGWGTPLKKRAATRIKISKSYFKRQPCSAMATPIYYWVNPIAPSVLTLNFRFAKYLLISAPEFIVFGFHPSSASRRSHTPLALQRRPADSAFSNHPALRAQSTHDRRSSSALRV